MQDDNEILVATLYKFVEVDDLNALQDQLYSICNKNKVMGTILIADEGVNGTISAEPKNLKKALISIQKADLEGHLDHLPQQTYIMSLLKFRYHLAFLMF